MLQTSSPQRADAMPSQLDQAARNHLADELSDLLDA